MIFAFIQHIVLGKIVSYSLTQTGKYRVYDPADFEFKKLKYALPLLSIHCLRKHCVILHSIGCIECTMDDEPWIKVLPAGYRKYYEDKKGIALATIKAIGTVTVSFLAALFAVLLSA